MIGLNLEERSHPHPLPPLPAFREYTFVLRNRLQSLKVSDLF